MAYALKQKKGLSIVKALEKKDTKWALMVLQDPSLVEKPELADPNGLNELGWTPLHYCAAHDWQDVFEALLQKGGDISGQGTFGATPLHVAAQNSRLDMIRKLVKAGADVNALDVGGRTPLLECARWNKTDSARLLLELGADPSIVSGEGLNAVEQSRRADGSVAKIIEQFKK